MRSSRDLPSPGTYEVTSRPPLAAPGRHSSSPNRRRTRELLSQSLVLVSLYEFFLGHGIRRDLMERAATLEQSAADAAGHGRCSC